MRRVRYPVLVLDSSSPRLTVAVRRARRGPVHSASVTGFRGHVRHLVPLAERVLARARLAWKDVPTVAAGLGPGSFTGLRVGLAALKAFALGGSGRILGACSLALTGYRAAQSLAARGRRGTLAVLVNARREKAYALAVRVRPGAVRISGRVRLVPLAEVPQLLRKVDWAAGDLREELERRAISLPANLTWLAQSLWYPDARVFFDILDQPGLVRSFTVKTLKPLYLHPPL